MGSGVDFVPREIRGLMEDGCFQTMNTSSTWINLRELREQLRFTPVLAHYQVEVRGAGTQQKGPCPLPGHGADRSRATFSADLSRGIFHCFACKAKGNVLEFAARMEGVDPRDGKALRQVAQELYERLLQPCEAPTYGGSPSFSGKVSPQRDAPRVIAVNDPLDFFLKALDQNHAYFKNAGLTAATVRHFELGVCYRGCLNGRVAVPIKNSSGHLIGYAGRVLDDREIAEGNPKYVYREGRGRNDVRHVVRRGNVLYNAFRLPGSVNELLVVELPEDVWWMKQAGFPQVVATFGEIQDNQRLLIDGLVEPRGRIVVVSPGEGNTSRWADIAASLSNVRLTRWMPISGVKHLAEMPPSGFKVILGK